MCLAISKKKKKFVPPLHNLLPSASFSKLKILIFFPHSSSSNHEIATSLPSPPFLAVTIVELKAQALFPSPFQLTQSPSPSSLSSWLLRLCISFPLYCCRRPVISPATIINFSLHGPQHRLPLLFSLAQRPPQPS